MFSLLTFNTYGVPFFSPYPKQRFILLAKKIEAIQPDIVCFQEVHTYSLLHALKKHLPSFPFCAYKKSLYGTKGGLVIFSRLPVHNMEFLTFSLYKDRPTEKVWQLFSLRKKGVLVIEFEGFSLLNVHLSANISGDWSINNKYEKTQAFELQQLTQIVKKLNEKKNKVLLTGDFNIAKKSSLYSNFIRAASLDDVFKENQSPTFHAEFLPSKREPQVIDFIFYSKNAFHILDKKLVFQEKEKIGDKLLYLSDHIGLYSKLS